MIPINLKITLIIAVCCYFILILIFLKRKALELKYTLLWLLAGGIMGLAVLFPQLLFRVTKFLGITGTMNGLYVLCIGFVLIILMALTSIVSKQTMKIRTLIQENAMLEKRVRELEDGKYNVEESIINSDKL